MKVNIQLLFLFVTAVMCQHNMPLYTRLLFARQGWPTRRSWNGSMRRYNQIPISLATNVAGHNPDYHIKPQQPTKSVLSGNILKVHDNRKYNRRNNNNDYVKLLRHSNQLRQLEAGQYARQQAQLAQIDKEALSKLTATDREILLSHLSQAEREALLTHLDEVNPIGENRFGDMQSESYGFSKAAATIGSGAGGYIGGKLAGTLGAKLGAAAGAYLGAAAGSRFDSASRARKNDAKYRKFYRSRANSSLRRGGNYVSK